jgi:hypothetical protein
MAENETGTDTLSFLSSGNQSTKMSTIIPGMKIKSIVEIKYTGVFPGRIIAISARYVKLKFLTRHLHKNHSRL